MKDTKPLVSVITPVFNSSRFILDCINSVKGQTYENWELLLVDDCSTDNSVHIIKKEINGDKRIQLIQSDTNGGPAIARNMALSRAKGEYISFLDGDDLWLPEKMETQLAFMMDNNISFSFTEYGLIDEGGNELNKRLPIPPIVDYSFLLKNTIIGCLTVMLQKKAFNIIRMPNLKRQQDYALWLSLLRQGGLAHGLQQKLALYRIIKGSHSSNKLKAAINIWNVYKLEELNLLQSWWCFLNYSFKAVKKRI